jgi:hypothetical protein
MTTNAYRNQKKQYPPFLHPEYPVQVYLNFRELKGYIYLNPKARYQVAKQEQQQDASKNQRRGGRKGGLHARNKSHRSGFGDHYLFLFRLGVGFWPASNLGFGLRVRLVEDSGSGRGDLPRTPVGGASGGSVQVEGAVTAVTAVTEV